MNALKIYTGGEEVYLHAFLTSAKKELIGKLHGPVALFQENKHGNR
jgi:hypothetical protein